MLRSALTGLVAVSAFVVPGSIAQAAPRALPAPATVEQGTVLRPAPARYVLPVRGYRITGEYGDTSYHWRSQHTGLDFAAASGTPIRSVADGTVTSTGYDGRYGTKTVVELEDGTQIWFCHQDTATVRVGERVRAGEVIGTVGSTGNATGPHLHLEVRPGPDRTIDPFAWLRAHGVRA